MTILHQIKKGKGPSQWEVMLSLFENKVISFTLENGYVMPVILSTVHDFRAYNMLNRTENHDREHIDQGWLLHGSVHDDWDQDAFIEYDMRNRTGTIVLVSSVGEEKPVQLRFDWLPEYWRVMMDLPAL